MQVKKINTMVEKLENGPTSGLEIDFRKKLKFQKIVSKKNKIVRFSSQTPFLNFISLTKKIYF